MPSIAVVVQTSLRIPTSNWRKGTNPAQAASQSRTIAGYFPPQALVNSTYCSSAVTILGRCPLR